MLNIPFLFLFCSLWSCAAGQENSREEMWVEYQVKDSLPNSALARMQSYMKDGFQFADFREPYAATDFIKDKHLPSRQLRYLAKKGEIWQLTYRHGGRGMHYHFVEFKVFPTGVELQSTGTTLVDLDTRLQIESAIKGKMLNPVPLNDNKTELVHF